MASGGYRPGAGRKKTDPRKVPARSDSGVTETPEPPQHAPDIDPTITPLGYLLTVVMDRNAPPTERRTCAIAALPYCHVRPEAIEAAKGKKGAAKDRADAAATSGKFRPSAPPKLKAVG